MAKQKEILEIDIEINMCKKWDRTAYNFMLSINKKVWWINFPIDLDRKNIKLTLSGYWPADIDKLLKMNLAPPGGRGRVVKVGDLVRQTMSN